MEKNEIIKNIKNIIDGLKESIICYDNPATDDDQLDALGNIKIDARDLLVYVKYLISEIERKTKRS